MQYVHGPAAGVAGTQTSPGPAHVPVLALPQHPRADVGDFGTSLVAGAWEGMQPSSLITSGATVADPTPLVIAWYVVQLPSQGLGASNAVPEPGLAQFPVFAVTVPGSAHEPVDGWQVHA